MVDVIGRGEPAIMVCHWPGIYYGGEEVGFNIFKEVVGWLEAKYDNLIWMKLSEITRYWAAKELTWLKRQGDTVTLDAPFPRPPLPPPAVPPARHSPQHPRAEALACRKAAAAPRGPRAAQALAGHVDPR